MTSNVDEADLKDSNHVGDRMRMVRQSYGLSQRELARRADVTNGTLSNIEKGKVSPSIQSLERILSAFPMSLQEFFSDQTDTAPSIVKAHQMVRIQKDATDYTILPLNGVDQEGAYISLQSYQPGARVKSQWMVRDGYVGGIVIRGVLSLVLEGVEHQLQKDEGFHFALQRPHFFSNQTQNECLIASVSFIK